MNVFSIPPAANFLETTAKTLVEGKLIPGFHPADDPLLLSTATIYVPTRRAARTLAGEFLLALGKDAAILPAIRTLGDPGEDEALFDGKDLPLDVATPIAPMERRLQLYRMVQTWTNAVSQETKRLFGDEDIVIPSTPADAMWLAGDLMGLMDQMETEEINWADVTDLVEEGHAQWWQLTLAFLKIAMETWPQHLKDNGKVEPAWLRGQLLDMRSKIYSEGGYKGPVVVAGSTGSIPATARFLKTVAQLPNGAVILPGLDINLGDADWKLLGSENQSDELISAPNQPQFGLAKLLQMFGVDRSQVRHLTTPSPVGHIREKIISLAMSPAETSDNWLQASADLSPDLATEALNKIALVEAPTERHEALAIALALRETLTIENKTAALVTPDRGLARRVAAELHRFGIEIDDSGGHPLIDTEAAKFLMLIQDVCLDQCKPIKLVSLLKHPLFSVGYAADEVRRLACLVELALVRGRVTPPVPGTFGSMYEQARAASATDKYQSAPMRRMSEEDWQDLGEFCKTLDQLFLDLADLGSADDEHGLETYLSTLYQTAIEASYNPNGAQLLLQSEGGTELSDLISEIVVLQPHEIRLRPEQFSPVFEAILDKTVVRATGLTHPRLQILGPLEARLQKFDRVVVAGLSEGTWPPATRSDPFLNRVMQNELNMAPPERRIGLSAHDFQQLLGNSEVLLTRSARKDNAPTVASRWLQRITTIVGKKNAAAMTANGNIYLGWATALDQSADVSTLADRPNPTPPISLRPKAMAVSDVETWIRDPYAIYAKHVLKLRPLPPLEPEVGPALRGTLYHAVLAEFVNGGYDPGSPDALSHMQGIVDTEFARQNVPDEAAAIWVPRFLEIARNYLEWDADRSDEIDRSVTEIKGTMEVGPSRFQLSATADRIDIAHDDRLTILDYKTGVRPTIKEARTFAPQLPLEGVIAARGGFGDIAKAEIAELALIRLQSGDRLKVDILSDKNRTAAEVAEAALGRLEQLINAYLDPGQGYLSRFAPRDARAIEGDYDHLARVKEWSAGRAGEDGANG